MNKFIGEGNLGQDPELKTVTAGGEPQEVANLRVYFDRPVADSEGNFKDRKGFWLAVEVWGARARQVARLCVKGSRVAVIGALRDDSYERDGATVNHIAVRARHVYLVPTPRMEQVRYRSDVAA